jgi:hypothetical protein
MAENLDPRSGIILLGEKLMPVHKVKGGYKWGKSGKVYKTKAAAERQGRAIYASGYKKKK